MAKKKKKQYSIGLVPLLTLSISFSILLTVFLAGYFNLSPALKRFSDNVITVISTVFDNAETSYSTKPPAGSNLEVHYIDVGQGDSILIRTSQKNVLIDAGENNKGDVVVNYLKKLGIKSLDIIIGTHPHSDHIGGMDLVIDNMNINTVIMPKLPDNMIPTTRTYEDVLKSIQRKNLKITPAKPYDEYDLGGGAKLTILAPLTDLKGLNNMSVVSRLDFGECSFLFTGDIEKEAEENLLTNLKNIEILDVDIYDTPHHGSNSSSTAKFLKAVSPKAAMISCGQGNDYGHPHKETITKLLKITDEVHRTDLEGSIVIKCDGKNYTFESKKMKG